MTVAFDRRKTLVERLGVPPFVAIIAVLVVGLAFHLLWRAVRSTESTATTLGVAAIALLGVVMFWINHERRRMRERQIPQLDTNDRVVRVGRQTIPFEEVEVRVFRFRDEVVVASGDYYDEKANVTRYEVYLRTDDNERFPVDVVDTEAEAERFAKDLRGKLEARD